MPPVKVVTVVLFSTLIIHSVQAQQTDSTKSVTPGITTGEMPINWANTKNKTVFPLKSLLVPTALVAYGITSIENRGLHKISTEIKEELYTENPHKKFPFDNYLQFAPAVTVYGLNALGIKGKNNLRDRTMIYLMSNIILNTTVYSIKNLSHQLRPDGSNYLSFPSGHTAEAFASAEFLRQEYKGVSPWYGVAGYAMAATTGFLRMYNNKHWLGDVAAGAGIGIASTKIAYWLYPKIQHKLFKDKPVHTIVMPTYQNGSFGLGLVHHF